MNNPEFARELALRWFREVWNEHKTETIHELLASDAVGHLEGGRDVIGAEHFAAFHASLLQALPDLQVEILRTIAETDQVCVLWRFTGTHTGPAFGLPPTGAALSTRGMTWFRIANGRIIEGWDAWNQEALLTTLAGGAPIKLGA